MFGHRIDALSSSEAVGEIVQFCPVSATTAFRARDNQNGAVEPGSEAFREQVVSLPAGVSFRPVSSVTETETQR